MRQSLGVSERRGCRTPGQHRSTQRKTPQGRSDEDRLTDDIIELTRTYRRYRYRMIAGLLNNAGWHVNHKRVERIRCSGDLRHGRATNQNQPLANPARFIGLRSGATL